MSLACVAWPPPLASRTKTVHVSTRDQLILDLARRKMRRDTNDFDEALRALDEAVAEVIPAGRTYFLGNGDDGPIVGSIISGIGITRVYGEVLVVRADTHVGWTALRRFRP